MSRVVKIGGRAQSSADLAHRLADAWREAPGSFCLVHGGGDEVSALQRLKGKEPRFVDGRRFTTTEDIEIVRMVLSGAVNKRLVSNLTAAGIPAVGISGEDGATITAEPLDADRLGRAGRPVSVNARLIQTLLIAGYLPVISPVAADDSGPAEALNVNGDDAAAAIAIALEAEELLMVVDVTGVLRADGRMIACLDQTETSELAQAGAINRGMVAKVEAGFAALAGGVRHVRISNVEGIAGVTGTLLRLSESLAT